MDWLKIMMMTRHHRTWGERAFGYVIAGKRFKTFLSHTWLGRNFDFTALFVVSIPALILFFATLPSGITVYSIIEKYTLLIGALLGFPILIKRVSINQETLKETQKQSRTSQETLKEAQKQSRTSQYRDARDLLQSDQLRLRMMGIADLWRFAKTHPQEEYHNVMDVFTQFIKRPPSFELSEEQKQRYKDGYAITIGNVQVFQKELPVGKRPDIRAIFQHMVKKEGEVAKSYQIDMSRTNLEGAYFPSVHLEKAELMNSRLRGVMFLGARLDDADLSNANLEGADLRFSNLEGTDLRMAKFKSALLEGSFLQLAIINNADFSEAIGLTQKQIDKCVFITDDYSYTEKPLLPKGLRFTKCERLSRRDWEKACEERERESKTAYDIPF